MREMQAAPILLCLALIFHSILCAPHPLSYEGRSDPTSENGQLQRVKRQWGWGGPWGYRPWGYRPWGFRPWGYRPWGYRPWGFRPWGFRPWGGCYRWC